MILRVYPSGTKMPVICFYLPGIETMRWNIRPRQLTAEFQFWAKSWLKKSARLAEVVIGQDEWWAILITLFTGGICCCKVCRGWPRRCW